MSGIVGVFHLDGRRVEQRELKRLAAASEHRAVDGEDSWIGSSAGLVHQHFHVTPESLTERQPLVSPSGIAVAFDGRLDNRQDIIDTCSPVFGDGERICSDPALVLAAYERFEEDFASRLNGDFAVAVFDRRARRLVLARDVMGARTLYFCALPRTLLFASEIKSVLAHPDVTARPDEDALADLVLDGYSDGHRTCFQGVHSVPEGHVLIATADGITLRRHWDFDPARGIRYRSFDEYAACFGSLFEQAVRRRLRSAHPVAISVSGGLDSSSIFCQAAAASYRVGTRVPIHGIAMTFPGDATADEASYLSPVERASGLPIARLPISRLRFPTDSERVTGQMEMPGLMWDSHAKVLAHARQLGCASILDGYFGDQVLFNRGYLVDLVRHGRWLKVRHDLCEFAAWMTDVEAGCFERQLAATLVRSLPPRWLFQAVKKQTARRRSIKRHPRWYTPRFLERAVERALSRPTLDRRFPSRHAEQYYRQLTSGFYRVQVHQADAAGLVHNVEVLHPYRDRDLVAFLMAIPGEVVNWNGIPKGLLRQALKGVVPEAVRQRRGKADLTGLANRGVVTEYPAIKRLLTRDCWSVRAGFTDGTVVERELATLETQLLGASTAAAGWQIGGLLGLELWLRRFFGSALS